ncbi:MAG: HIT family protein [Clostridium sp.]|nr:HIT family protein [Dethiobacter sp.]MBS4007553.1 HIT family protein [Clostridium sp.]
MDDCVFCRKTATDILCENELAKAFYDGFPVNRGHVLIVTKKHVASYFDASSEEIQAICELIVKVKKLLDEKYQPDGYNIGVNVGKAAGQTVFHLQRAQISTCYLAGASPVGVSAKTPHS